MQWKMLWLVALAVLALWLPEPVSASSNQVSANVIFRVPGATPAEGPEAYKTAHFLYYADGVAYAFPDQPTYEVVLADLHFNISFFPLPIAKMLLKKTPVPILPSIVSNGNSKDSIRGKMVRARILERSDFVDEKSILELPGLVNPSFVFYDKRVLVCWKDGSKIAFGWFDGENQHFNETVQHLGVGGERRHIIDFNRSQEDARLTRLSDLSILVTFASTEVVGPNRVQSIFCYCFLRYNNASGQLVSSPVATFDYELNTQQKNWMPFEFDRRIYLLHSLQPRVRTISLQGETADHYAVYKDVPSVAHARRAELPWRPSFGNELHGGTPAVRVSEDLFLFFFHVMDHKSAPWNMYMGAGTLCANNLTSVHSLSAQPIVVPDLYSGRFYNRRVGYVVFPVGLDINMYSSEYVTVSIGLQDSRGVMVNMKLQPLLDSLSVVAPCS